jgi:Gas vesicle synthesis protein GvpL/GvpF
VIELYAITDDPTPPDPPVRAVRSDGLAVLYAPAERQAVTAETLWHHEQVVEGLMADREILPVRYGTFVPDPSAAAEAVAKRSDELAASLERVRGAVELAVRVEISEPEAESTESGRDYMTAKVRRMAKADLVHERLSPVAREHVIRPGPELLRAAYLVDRAEVEHFVSLVLRLQESHPDLDLVCTGPWPPYSFAMESQ